MQLMKETFIFRMTSWSRWLHWLWRKRGCESLGDAYSRSLNDSYSRVLLWTYKVASGSWETAWWAWGELRPLKVLQVPKPSCLRLQNILLFLDWQQAPRRSVSLNCWGAFLCIAVAAQLPSPQVCEAEEKKEEDSYLKEKLGFWRKRSFLWWNK